VSQKVQKYPLDEFYDEFPDLKKYNVELFLDVTNKKIAKGIINELKSKKKKFKRILYVALSNQYNRELYSLEEKNITAMKFKGKFNNNLRIYCKECFKDGKKIIMINYLHKATQKNKEDHKIVNIIDQIKKYTYDEFEK